MHTNPPRPSLTSNSSLSFQSPDFSFTKGVWMRLVGRDRGVEFLCMTRETQNQNSSGSCLSSLAVYSLP